MKTYQIYADRDVGQIVSVEVEASSESEALELAKVKIRSLPDDEWDFEFGGARNLNIHLITEVGGDEREWTLDDSSQSEAPSIEHFRLEPPVGASA